MPEVIQRTEQFFDIVCIDEVQDFAANDFNFLCKLANANLEMLLVGDFYQHTFDTSRDGNTQRSLHSCFEKYCEKLANSGYSIDLDSLSNSYRCSPCVCSFIENNLGITIQSHREDKVIVLFLDQDHKIDPIYANDSIVKLFFQKSDAYAGNTDNWGNTKGLDHFQDVCVALNPTTLKAFETEQLSQLKSMTKNKLYVACTRAKRNLYFVPEKN